MMSESITRTRHVLQRTGFAEPPRHVVRAAVETPATLLASRLSSRAPIAPLAPPDWVDGPILDFATFRDLEEARRRAAHRRLRQIQRERLAELQAWWITSLIRTENPLGARMTLFWQNHFTSAQRKVRYVELMYRQHATLMAHATGRFGDLLLEVLKDPAMLLYLDNHRSRRGRLNENLARELLELFTLGEGAYAEHDIRELARALTGLAIDPEQAFVFREGAHDPAPKTLLGTDGVRGVDDVVEVLTGHPATARHLTAKLWRHFVSPTPEPEHVEALAEDFRAGDLDIAALLGAMLGSDAFLDPATFGTLVKSPLELVVGTHRALALAPLDPPSLVRAVRSMQQSPYEPPNVRGWVGGVQWINSATLLARRRFVNGMLRSDALDPAALRGELSADELVAALLPLPPVTPLPPVPAGNGAGAGKAAANRAASPAASPAADPATNPATNPGEGPAMNPADSSTMDADPLGARDAKRRRRNAARRDEPIARLLRDPVHNLC